MESTIITGSIDELAVPVRTEVTRRDLLKRFGIGGLVVAAAVMLEPFEAAAADASLTSVSLGIDKSGANALIKVYYTLRLSDAAVAEINRGYRYGIQFSLYNGAVGNAGNAGSAGSVSTAFHVWSSGPLPAQSRFVHSTSQTLKWDYVRKNGSSFFARLQVYKKEVGRTTLIDRSVSTRTIRI